MYSRRNPHVHADCAFGAVWAGTPRQSLEMSLFDIDEDSRTMDQIIR